MNDAHDEDGVDWSQGTIIWPPQPGEDESQGPRFNLTTADELLAFLPIAARDDFALAPDELVLLVKQAAALGVFVDVPNVPSNTEWLKTWFYVDPRGRDIKQAFDLLKLRTFKSIAAQLGAILETQEVGLPLPGVVSNGEPLTPCDREILAAMLEMGATDENPRVQADIIQKATDGLNTKNMFDNLKARGLIGSKKKVGTWLTPEGIETAKRITGN